jgi:RNA polymerase sigma-70 factor (sigma-E family)
MASLACGLRCSHRRPRLELSRSRRSQPAPAGSDQHPDNGMHRTTLAVAEGVYLYGGRVHKLDATFEAWARSRMPSLLRAAFLLTSNQQDAEDLVQDALSRTYARWSRIHHDPDSYCRRVLYTTNITRWRRRRWREIDTADVPDSVQSGCFESESVTRLTLLAALRHLPHMQRSVLVARYLEDLSEAEAAALLGCSIGTIKSHASRARLTLRTEFPELDDYFPERATTS